MPSLCLSLVVKFLKVHLSSGIWGKKCLPSSGCLISYKLLISAPNFSSYDLQANSATKMALHCLEQL